jgi:hypothetical protein
MAERSDQLAADKNFRQYHKIPLPKPKLFLRGSEKSRHTKLGGGQITRTYAELIRKGMPWKRRGARRLFEISAFARPRLDPISSMKAPFSCKRARL